LITFRDVWNDKAQFIDVFVAVSYMWKLSRFRQEEEEVQGHPAHWWLEVWYAWFQLHLTLKLMPWWN